MNPTIYETEDREMHVFGEYVAVCWNFDDNGNKEDSPYISFVQVRVRDGKVYERDDTLADSGFDAQGARNCALLLIVAADYLENPGNYNPVHWTVDK